MDLRGRGSASGAGGCGSQELGAVELVREPEVVAREVVGGLILGEGQAAEALLAGILPGEACADAREGKQRAVRLAYVPVGHVLVVPRRPDRRVVDARECDRLL